MYHFKPLHRSDVSRDFDKCLAWQPTKGTGAMNITLRKGENGGDIVICECGSKSWPDSLVAAINRINFLSAL